MPSESNFVCTRKGESLFSPVLLHCWFTFNRCRYLRLYQRGISTLTVLTNVCAGDAHMLLDITPAIKYPKAVIPAKAGIQENTLGIILQG